MIGGIPAQEHQSVHHWLRVKYGKAYRCSNPECPIEEAGSFQWALLHGKEYKKDIRNFVPLCATCHVRYDRLIRGLKDTEEAARVRELINNPKL